MADTPGAGTTPEATAGIGSSRRSSDRGSTLLYRLTLAPLVLALVFLLLLGLTYRHILETTQNFSDEFERASPTMLSIYKDSVSPMLAIVTAQSADAMILLEVDVLNDSVDLLLSQRIVESAVYLDPADKVLAAGSDPPEGIRISQALPQGHRLDVPPRTSVFEVRDDRLIFSERSTIKVSILAACK